MPDAPVTEQHLVQLTLTLQEVEVLGLLLRVAGKFVETVTAVSDLAKVSSTPDGAAALATLVETLNAMAKAAAPSSGDSRA